MVHLIAELFQSIKEKDNDKAQDLIDNHPSLLLSKDEVGNSPLLTAVYYRAPQIVQMLLTHGTPITIFEAAALGRTESVVNMLQGNTDWMESYSHDGFTLLGLASFFGHKETVSMLLSNGANPNLSSSNDMKVMPLHSAAASKHIDVARLLLEHGANVNAKQQVGWTPLHSAIHNRHAEMIILLLNYGADVHLANDEGLTPIYLAEKAGYSEGSELLQK